MSGSLYAIILCLTGCSCLYSCFYRSKLRGQYFLEESPCTDCCIHCCCEECSLCQEYRELTHQGFDMSIGLITFISFFFGYVHFWYHSIFSIREKHLPGTTHCHLWAHLETFEENVFGAPRALLVNYSVFAMYVCKLL